MRRLRLLPCLALFGPGFALLGAFSTLDSGMPVWWELMVGGVLGVFFGLVFGGNHKWKVWDHIFGPEAPDPDDRPSYKNG
jgi:hypothetical protein